MNDSILGGKMTPRKTRDSGCCSINLLKTVLHIFNFIFLISGLTILGIGIWIVVDKYQYITLLTNATYAITVYVFIGTGSLIIFISFIGCSSVSKENRPYLLWYIFLLLLIFLLEAMVGIMSYIYREQVRNELEHTLNSTFLDNYRIDATKTQAIDQMQQQYKCCGAVRFEDWKYSQWMKQNKTKYPTPDSCCKTVSLYCGKSTSPSNIYYNGCLEYLIVEIRTHLSILSAIGLGLCVIQIFGINIACSLYLKLRHVLD